MLETRSGNPSQLVLEAARSIRMWRYGVGHSQLLFRALPDSGHVNCLDIHFEDVMAIFTEMDYRLVEIRSHSFLDFRERLGLSDRIPDLKKPLVIELRSEGSSGYVVCGKVRVLIGGPDVFSPVSEDPENVIWTAVGV